MEKKKKKKTAGNPYKWRVCSYVRNMKKCMGILKSFNIVNTYRIMSMLKLKIYVNLPQLLCIVVSAVQNGECDLVSSTLTVTR